MKRTTDKAVALAIILAMEGFAVAQPAPAAFDDHQNMMDQLGIKKLRRGPDPNNQSTFDEATSNPYTNISYGIVERGDAKWVDAHGSFMAGVLAGPVYRLLGKKDFGTPGDYLSDPMPPINQLIGGELAWRQHDGGHDVTPNWPAFFKWVAAYITAPPRPAVPSAVTAEPAK